MAQLLGTLYLPCQSKFVSCDLGGNRYPGPISECTGHLDQWALGGLPACLPSSTAFVSSIPKGVGTPNSHLPLGAGRLDLRQSLSRAISSDRSPPLEFMAERERGTTRPILAASLDCILSDCSVSDLGQGTEVRILYTKAGLASRYAPPHSRLVTASCA